MSGSAIISPCGRYRYRLSRALGDIGPTMAFIMVNPSTADAAQDDPTIRKCIGFAQRHGCGEIIVGNLFAYRATEVTALRKASDPIGPENDRHLSEIMWDADEIVVAWGKSGKVPERLRSRWKDVVRIFDARHPLTGERRPLPLRCLGTCADGHPKHPLMVSYETPLTDWQVPWFANRHLASEQKG